MHELRRYQRVQLSAVSHAPSFGFVESVGVDGQPVRIVVSDAGRVVRLTGHLADNLADIESTLSDLKTAAWCFDLLASRVPPRETGAGTVTPGDPVEGTITLALFMAGVISYARAFDPGVRGYRLDSKRVARAASDEKPWSDYHSKIIAIRDKHVAHSVNGHEETLIGLLLADTNAPEILDVRTWHGRLMGVWRDEARDWAELARLADSIARLDSVSAREQIVDAAAADLSAAYGLPPLTIEMGAVADPAQPRKRGLKKCPPT